MSRRVVGEDDRFMGRALTLARRGVGRVEPNPMVGCVIVRDGRIIAEGHHRRFGGPHAEVEALRAAGARARGATAYVTLEPCNHFGKTPPCTDALLAAGIKCVVAAMLDPNPIVAGRGIAALRAAGVEVAVGCMASEAAELNRPYLTWLKHRRPYLILKWAQTFDGWLEMPTGVDRRISGDAAHRWVHRLRARVDAIVVGINTVRTDDPLLTARGVAIRRTAARVVLDSNLRIGARSQLVRTARECPVIVMAVREACDEHPGRVRRLADLGVDVIPCRHSNGRVNLRDAVRIMYRRGMANVLVEGGPMILDEFLRSDLADELAIFVAPRLISGTISMVSIPLRFARDAQVAHRRMGADQFYVINRRDPHESKEA